MVDMETSNGLMPAAVEHMMLNRMLIVPSVEHANPQYWGQFVLARAEARSMVLQGSRIIRAQGLLLSTPSVHISGGRH